MAEFRNREKSGEEPIETGNNGNNSEDETPPFSLEEAYALAQKLTDPETFEEARLVLLAWFANGVCNDDTFGPMFVLTQLCSDYQDRFEAIQKEVEKVMEEMKVIMAEKNFDTHCNLYRMEKAIKKMENSEIFYSFKKSQKKRVQAMKNEVSLLWENFFRERICNTNVLNERIACNERNMLLFKQFSDRFRLDLIQDEIKELETKCKYYEQQISMLKSKLDGKNPNIEKASEYNPDHFYQSEVRLMGLMSLFLYHHLTGVDIDDIHSYINTIIPTIDAKEIENFLRKFPDVFGQLGFEGEKKWFYIGSYTEPPKGD